MNKYKITWIRENGFGGFGSKSCKIIIYKQTIKYIFFHDVNKIIFLDIIFFIFLVSLLKPFILIVPRLLLLFLIFSP